MAGHSKWANIKHKKAATDAKRGKNYTRLIRESSVSPNPGGSTARAIPMRRLPLLWALDNTSLEYPSSRAISPRAVRPESALPEKTCCEAPW